MLNIYAPYDGHLIKTIAYTTKEQVETCIANAHELFLDQNTWLSLQQRLGILEELYRMLQLKKAELAFVAAEESGKPVHDTTIELERALDNILMVKNYIYQLAGDVAIMGVNRASLHKRAFTQYEPIGVVYAICPFNKPLGLIINHTIASIAAGCPLIIKPSSKTPLSCMAIFDILRTTELPDFWCQMVVCDTLLAEKIVVDPRINFFAFTGSDIVGWYLRSKLSPGTRCTLMHGGGSQAIIDPEVNINEIIPGIISGSMYHAGQDCFAIKKLYVHKKIFNKFKKALVTAINAINIGDPMQHDTRLGPLINLNAITNIKNHLDAALYDGAKLIVGGEIINKTCLAPTVIMDLPAQTQLARIKIHAPVIILESYSKLLDVIKVANATSHNLHTSVYTNNIEDAWVAVGKLKTNMVLINEHPGFAVDWVSFVGKDENGLGNNGIIDLIKNLLYPKQIIWHSKYL